MRTSWNENHAILRGTVAETPVFSHSNHNVDFFVFPLSVPRLSGTEDRLNVVVPQTLLECSRLSPGQRVAVTGEVRTFNNRTGPGSRLVITLLARTLADTEEPPCNQLSLSGVLCKPPILRRTPLGREICDLMLAVNRRYGRADYLPCITWGALAQRCNGLSVGDCVELEGRLQSRLYQKVVGGVTQERTAFEVSVTTLAPIAPEAASG